MVSIYLRCLRALAFNTFTHTHNKNVQITNSINLISTRSNKIELLKKERNIKRLDVFRLQWMLRCSIFFHHHLHFINSSVFVVGLLEYFYFYFHFLLICNAMKLAMRVRHYYFYYNITYLFYF